MERFITHLAQKTSKSLFSIYVVIYDDYFRHLASSSCNEEGRKALADLLNLITPQNNDAQFKKRKAVVVHGKDLVLNEEDFHIVSIGQLKSDDVFTCACGRDLPNNDAFATQIHFHSIQCSVYADWRPTFLNLLVEDGG